MAQIEAKKAAKAKAAKVDGRMKVILAEHAGACYGVQRALDMAVEASAEGEGASTLGPLIHNPQVVADLAARGVRAVVGTGGCGARLGDHPQPRRHAGCAPYGGRARDCRSSMPPVRTSPALRRPPLRSLAVADCVVVVGEEGHPEVEGLVAHAREAGGEVAVVAGPGAILPDGLEAPVGIVVQTTQTREALDAVVAALVARGIEPEVKNTICFATRQRQESAAALADAVDAIVVIGGRNSSNTTRLADICAAALPAHAPRRGPRGN